MARWRNRTRTDTGPPSAPRWVVTFTDMVSLLVTFFVLLMTFSSMEHYDALLVDSWLSGNRGIHRIAGFTLPEISDEKLRWATNVERGALRPHSRPLERLPEDLEEMGQKRTDDHLELDLNDVGDGLVLEFGEDECFDPGSAAVNASLRETLVEVGRVLENYPHLVVVEGFTDGAFHSTVAHPTADDLSLERAQAAASVLVGSTDVNRWLVQVSGHGERNPRADNRSVGGRRLNRRVRLRVQSLSKLRTAHLEAQGGL